MILDESKAREVAQFVKSLPEVQETFSEICEERSIDPNDLRKVSEIHVYGMALYGIQTGDTRSLRKCCKFVLRSEKLKKDFRKKLIDHFEGETVTRDQVLGFEHICVKALAALGTDPCNYFPRIVVSSSESA